MQEQGYFKSRLMQEELNEYANSIMYFSVELLLVARLKQSQSAKKEITKTLLNIQKHTKVSSLENRRITVDIDIINNLEHIKYPCFGSEAMSSIIEFYKQEIYKKELEEQALEREFIESVLPAKRNHLLLKIKSAKLLISTMFKDVALPKKTALEMANLYADEKTIKNM